jgi:hypothetical protein
MDPWEEHAIKNPRCFHIRLVKGAKFIREVQVREIKRLQKKALFEDLPFSATMEKTTPADDEITDNTEGLFTSHHPLHSSKKRNKITNLSLSLFLYRYDLQDLSDQQDTAGTSTVQSSMHLQGVCSWYTIRRVPHLQSIN